MIFHAFNKYLWPAVISKVKVGYLVYNKFELIAVYVDGRIISTHIILKIM